MSEKDTHVTLECYVYSKLLAQKRNKDNTLSNIRTAYSIPNNLGLIRISDLFTNIIKTSVDDENTFYDIVDNGYRDEYNHTLYSIVWDVEKTKDNEGNEITNNILLNGLNVVNAQITSSDIPNNKNYWVDLSYKMLELIPKTYDEFLKKYHHYQLLLFPQLNNIEKNKVIDVLTKNSYIHTLSLFSQYQYYIVLDNVDNDTLVSKLLKKVSKELGIKERYIRAVECVYQDNVIPLLDDDIVTSLKNEISKGYTDIPQKKKGKKSTFTQKPSIVKEPSTEQTEDKSN